MNYFILILMLLIIFSGIFLERSRFASYAIMTVLFVLICFSYDSNDYHVYTKVYKNIGAYVLRYEPLFLALMKVGNIFHLNYNQFRMVITAIELMMIHSSICKFSNRPALCWSLFVIFPGWVMTTLLRHMMACTVIIYGLRYLFDDVKGSIWKLAITVAVASLIHNAFWVFLILLPAKYFSVRKLFWIYTAVVFITYFMGMTNFWFKLFELLPVSLSYIKKYMVDTYTNLNGIIYNVLRQCVIIFCGYVCICFYRRKVRQGLVTNLKQINLMETAWKVNISSIILLCILYYTVHGNRLYHPVIFINIISWCITTELYGKRTVRRLFGKMTMVGVSLLLSILLCTKESDVVFDMVLKMHFETNALINILR